MFTLRLLGLLLLVAGPAAAQELFEPAFPNLNFEWGIAVRNADDGSDYLYVADIYGRVYAFPNDDEVAAADTFLDLSNNILSDAAGGLLGLAFHPDYEVNRYFYVSYVTEEGEGPYRSRLSRFTAPAETGQPVDLETELILLDIERVAESLNHHGGDLHFGIPEGPDRERYLYLSLGDGQCCFDPLGSGQDRTTLFGSILRLDVDTPSGGRNYGIPPDNPFVGNAEGWREEIWAYGFRNPWRFSIDPETGDVWVGDVGELEWEEIDLVTAGGNYGWNTMEGPVCFDAEMCDQEGLTPPVWSYDHTVGNSVTGGYVYRGGAHPDFYGRYLFADWGSRKFWSLAYDPGSGEPAEVELLSDFTGYFVASLGTDEAGELYFVNLFLGDLYRFAPRPVSSEGEAAPEAALTLRPAYPNPFSGTTTLRYDLPVAGPMRMAVYDVLGREVAALRDGPAPAGDGVVTLEAAGLPAGVYLVRMTTPSGNASQTVTLLR